MGTKCASVVADSPLICYERGFMLSLSDNNQTAVTDEFNSTSRLLDDLLNIDIPYFKQMVSQIYPTEININRESSFDAGAFCLDLDFSMTSGIVSSWIWHGWGDINYEVVYFLFSG